MSDDFNSLLKEQEGLSTKRINWSTWWQEIAYRVMPSAAQFTTTSAEGEARSERLFDGNAVSANERFAALMDNLLTPRTQVWHVLAAEDEDLKSQAVKEYFEEVNKILFAMRYRPEANFAGQKHKGYLSVGAFGNSCMFIDEEMSRDYIGPRYVQFFLGEVYWGQNYQGVIDRVYRRFIWSAQNAVQRFGMDGVTEKIRRAAQSNPLQEFEFLHCVRPNVNRVDGRIDYTGQPWESWYGSVEDKAIIERKGYTSWPFAIGRYILAPNETYGRSPAMAAWPAICTINEEKKTVLRAAQKEVDPPVLLQEDGILDAFNLRPGALNYGAVSQDGQALAVPFKTGANVPLGMEMMVLEKQHIDDSFLVSLMRMITNENVQTATQVLEIAQERGIALAPIMGQQHSEDLGPMIKREIDIASKLGLLPEMPPELAEAGGTYKIEYRSPLARAMRAQDGVAILRTFEALPTAIALDPDSAYVIDVKGATRELAEINGMPAKFIREPRVVDAITAKKREDEQIAQAAAVAPEMSQAALNAAKAEQLRMGSA